MGYPSSCQSYPTSCESYSEKHRKPESLLLGWNRRNDHPTSPIGDIIGSSIKVQMEIRFERTNIDVPIVFSLKMKKFKYISFGGKGSNETGNMLRLFILKLE